MLRNGQPSRPSAMTCCRLSSLKTLLTPMEGSPPSHSMSCLVPIGRFLAVPHWPVFGVPRSPVFQVDLLLAHRQELLVRPEPHLHHDHNHVSQVRSAQIHLGIGA